MEPSIVMKYSIKIECENQKSVLNFQSELDSSVLVELFKRVVKSNYRVSITSIPFWNRRAKRSLETALLWAKDVKFYKDVVETTYTHEHERKHLFSMAFPAYIHVADFWHSDWGGTFFRLNLQEEENTHFVSPDFEKCREEFVKHNLDLHKSKTSGIWYTHYNVELVENYSVELPENCNELLIEKDIVTSKAETKTVRVEI